MTNIKILYQWKLPYLFKADPQKVGEELTIISGTPDDIVKFAKNNKKSELYKCFDWDDNVAGVKWRKQQARNISCNLKSIPVTVEMEKNKDIFQKDKIEVSSFTSVKIAKKDKEGNEKIEKKYVNTYFALSNDELRDGIFKDLSTTFDDIKDKIHEYNNIVSLIIKENSK